MTRGGKRPGAGGPRLTDESKRKLTVTITLDAATLAKLESYVVEHRLRSRGQAVERLLADEARKRKAIGK